MTKREGELIREEGTRGKVRGSFGEDWVPGRVDLSGFSCFLQTSIRKMGICIF